MIYLNHLCNAAPIKQSLNVSTLIEELIQNNCENSIRKRSYLNVMRHKGGLQVSKQERILL